MDKVINFKLISHPANWLVVIMMVVIAGAIGHSFLEYLGIKPKTQATSDYADIPAGTSVVNPPTRGIQPQGSYDVSSFGPSN